MLPRRLYPAQKPFQHLPRFIKPFNNFYQPHAGRGRAHGLLASTIPAPVYCLSSRRGNGDAASHVPRFQKTEAQLTFQDGYKVFSLECYDAALQNGEVDDCWKQILRCQGRESKSGRRD